jgi:hypothetical protein
MTGQGLHLRHLTPLQAKQTSLVRVSSHRHEQCAEATIIHNEGAVLVMERKVLEDSAGWTLHLHIHVKVHCLDHQQDHVLHVQFAVAVIERENPEGLTRSLLHVGILPMTGHGVEHRFNAAKLTNLLSNGTTEGQARQCFASRSLYLGIFLVPLH